jgi:hypothetical protein
MTADHDPLHALFSVIVCEAEDPFATCYIAFAFSRSFASCANRTNNNGLMISVDGLDRKWLAETKNDAIDPEQTSPIHSLVWVLRIAMLRGFA